MKGTERYWGVLGVSIVLAGGALIFTRPLLAVGSVSLCIWLIGAQINFSYRVQTIAENLQISQEFPVSTTAGSTVTVSLSATLSTPAKEEITVQARPPISATGGSPADQRLTLTSEETDCEQKYTITLPATGQTPFQGVTYHISDQLGIFTRTIHRQPTGQTSIEVSPYGPDQMQIGRGGQLIGQGYGEHEASHGGGGIDPQELRQYVAGDSLRDIDWNATARLPETYVREYDSAMTQQTLIVLDTRREMKQGSSGRTMLSHARRVGHGIVRTTQLRSDPLGWLAVDNASTAGFTQPESTPAQYRRAKRFFDTIDTTSVDTTTSQTASAQQSDSSAGSHLNAATALTRVYQPSVQTLADRKQIATRLAVGDSAFATQLQPFFTDTGGYMEAIDTGSLFHSLRVALQNTPSAVWTVIISSDERRKELFEAAQMASQGDSHVAVFLTPSVLFTNAIEVDPEKAYKQYQSFEGFRDRLNRLTDVTAFDIGPKDRLAEILNTQAASTERSKS